MDSAGPRFVKAPTRLSDMSVSMLAPKRKYESPRQLERQSAILASARRMLEKKGYAGVTMRALAREAGVAQATLYNIYGSKDDLILSAVEDLLVGLEAKIISSQAADGVDTILARGVVSAEQIQATPKYADAMARSLAGVQAGDPLVSVLYTRGLPFLQEHLRIAQEQGEILESVDIDGLAKHLIGQQWGVTWLWIMGVLPLENIVTERVRSDVMTLLAVSQGTARQRLEQKLMQLGTSV